MTRQTPIKKHAYRQDLLFVFIYNVQEYLKYIFAFVSGANDRNKLSEVAISEMTPPPNGGVPGHIFRTF